MIVTGLSTESKITEWKLSNVAHIIGISEINHEKIQRNGAMYAGRRLYGGYRG